MTGQGERNWIAIRGGGNIMTLTAYNHVPIPSFMYGTAWKKEATRELVQLAVASGFRAIDTANQLIHYEEALVGEALQAVAKKGIKRVSNQWSCKTDVSPRSDGTKKSGRFAKPRASSIKAFRC